MAQFSNVKPELDQYLRKNELKNILELPASICNGSTAPDNNNTMAMPDGDHVNGDKLVDLMSSESTNGEL